VKRRQLLAGAAVLGAGGALFGMRRDHGGAHSPYFQQMSRALDGAGLARPTLVIDRERLLANIGVLQEHLAGRFDYRVVAKSLPSVPLLETVMEHSGSNRLMAFHQPFLNLVADRFPNADVLLGKPMPVSAAQRFYQQHSNDAFQPALQLQWLVDTVARVEQYRQLAEQRGEPLRLNLELDVGLHRGGFDNPDDLAQALQLIQQSPLLEFSGFMGYEPHVAKMPGLLGGPDSAFAAAQQRYRGYVSVAEQVLGGPLDQSTLNAAGSPTYQRYTGAEVANELAAGSALVKPTDFDLDTLQDHQPACFIATPVIKALPSARVPGIERLSGVSAWLNPNRAQAFFIYGGYWKARPESPPGLSNNSLFGRSTNQEMLNGSASVQLAPDDWVFLRPTQSEHVFLQFGDIAVMDRGQIVEFWPVFTQGA
jgi:D-serine deaminase-like pyridoxal phosphate-dependent protein